VLVVLPSAPHVGSADQDSPGGSGSGSSRKNCAQNFAYKSAKGEIATAPHVGSADDKGPIGAQEAILAHRNRFRTKSIKHSMANFESITMYMLEVCVHANPAGGQPTQLARDFKFWWALTSRLFFF